MTSLQLRLQAELLRRLQTAAMRQLSNGTSLCGLCWLWHVLFYCGQDLLFRGDSIVSALRWTHCVYVSVCPCVCVCVCSSFLASGKYTFHNSARKCCESCATIESHVSNRKWGHRFSQLPLHPSLSLPLPLLPLPKTTNGRTINQLFL